MVNQPDYLPPDAADWRKYVEEWRAGNPELATQFGRLQDPIANLNETSMSMLDDVITTGLDRGYSALQIAEGVVDEGYVGVQGTFGRFEDWRSEMIARTEAREAFNAGGLRAYAEAQIGTVEAMDGDYDEECRIRNGERFEFNPETGEILADASELEEHPNGGLTWGPVATLNLSDMNFLRLMGDTSTLEAAAAEAEGAIQEAARIVSYLPTNGEGGRAVGDALHAVGKQGHYVRTESGAYVRQQLAPAASMNKLLDKTKALINSVHGDGRLPSLPVEATTKGMQNAGGMFSSNGRTGDAISIKIRETTGKNATSYLTHEIGHFLDNSALSVEKDAYGDPARWATSDITKGPIAQVFTAIQDSNMYKTDRAILDEIAKQPSLYSLPRDPITNRVTLPPYYGQGPFVNYALSNKELWARAYAQYIAEMTGDPESLATIQADVTGARVMGEGARGIAYQWTPEDFAPIKDAITQMFVDLGYMTPEEA